ncbi:sugar ABC transporter permease [Paenibacillus darwinianus]|uniref:Sugar ABC transporter permease n=1 Tax=Paenibacillus darwinianus TaxID=1380763 RepID=A0A9W5S1G9_9BACL|nr:carbohydrate ABC transporter permease [Paenibacillus darwinianus]EXX87824.1 sugar ABC transporter permease [Paenibacillus darwinianus]EXX88214.1 sugar ABC transporter permease [Paenibacillus darwinianus]EXX89070.1 sugar ABC transporter permease [Paenibacillus darwinianus]
MKRKGVRKSKWLVNTVLAIICVIWAVPTFGLLVSSFRPAADILSTGWWNIFPHKEWTTVAQIELPRDTDLRGPISVEGMTYSDVQLREGVERDGQLLVWENRRQRLINVQEKEWAWISSFTTQNYETVLGGKQYKITMPDGSVKTEQGSGMSQSFWNTIAVTIPATVIPIFIASFAAYAFAWLRFPGRRTLFVVIIALLVVPLQVALIPILRDYTSLGLNGTYFGIWLAHTAFGLPLITYFMYTSISQLPKDIFESAFMDGATNFTIFSRLILPLSVPALASISIFQFLWVWNDYLVSLIFLGSQPEVQVMSMKIANLVGSRGNDWQLLTAAAFVSMLMPLTVFFALQRYFVRGMLGGSVKG